jgi:pyruvate dehydrogenase E1 component alpha subunit
MDLVVFNEKIDPRKYDKDLLTGLLESMKLQRSFDKSILRLVSEGKLPGFYHPGSGQEGVSAGAIWPMRDDDYLFYMHRGCNDMIAKKVPLDKLYSDFYGNINGTNLGLGAGIIHGADPSRGVLGQPGTIGSSMPLACGVGMAINYRETDQIVYVTFGDGTSNRELLHGSFNYAALWKLPVIFMCQNNEYALGASFKDEHALVDGYIASRGLSYGIPSYVVDGNDVLAVYEVTQIAVERARKGEGPTFIEAKTMRHKGHHMGDARRYMDKERQQWFIDFNDPINRFQKLLLEYGIFTSEEFDAIDSELIKFNNEAIAKAESFPMPAKERLFAGLFSTSPVPNV